MNLTVEPSELLDESTFSDFLKALALGVSLQFASMAHAYDGTVDISAIPTEVANTYNTLKKTDKIGVVKAQEMADEAIMHVGKEAVEGAAEQTDAWQEANETYENLIQSDYVIATAFIGRFNHNAKKLFGSQIRALPKPIKKEVTESIELPINESYLNEKIG